MALSVCCLLWIIASLAIVVWLMLLNFQFSETLYKYLHTLFYFGKLRDSTIVIKSPPTDIPKRWFLHFYIIGVFCTTIVLLLFIVVMLLGADWPKLSKIIFSVLNFPKNPPANVKYNGVSILMILIMEEVQVLRRLYECLYVHNFSKSKMSIVHYCMGVVFYSLFAVSVLAEVNLKNLKFTSFQNELVAVVPAVCLFCWAWLHQHHAFQILAQLRINRKDPKSTCSGHYLPFGGLFQYVSCPHYLTEILIYFSVNLIVLFQHRTLLCCLVFVCVNQITVALETHRWYKNTFASYPKHRRAIIPYIL